jgi:hypothetical protein
VACADHRGAGRARGAMAGLVPGLDPYGCHGSAE